MSDGSARGPGLFAGNGTDAPAGRAKFVRGNDDIGRPCVTGSSIARVGEVNMSEIGAPSNQNDRQFGPIDLKIRPEG
jgi:hypothetical protein